MSRASITMLAHRKVRRCFHVAPWNQLSVEKRTTPGKSNRKFWQSNMPHAAAFRGVDPFLSLTHVLVDHTAQLAIEKVVSHPLMALTRTRTCR